MKVVVAGGGYAGLACLLELRKLAPLAQLHLVDPGAAHLKQTQLHEALHRPLAALRVPFADLAERYRFGHTRAALGRNGEFGPEELERWDRDRQLRLGRARLEFDYLVIATGARPRLRAPAAGARGRLYDQLALREREGRDLVARLLREDDAHTRATVAGGGASGVQFAFELAELLRGRGSRARVRLIDAGRRLLEGLPAAAHEYLHERLAEADIEYLPETSFVSQAGERLRVRTAGDGRERELASSLTLLFAGVAPHPVALRANRHGRVMIGGATLSRVFAAGDCVQYAARGLNALTAQAAVRKGKHVAANITRLERGRIPVAYGFQELGYVVSLGRLDCVGWLLVPGNVVRGVAAVAIRNIVEAQYDLFVDGLDTYLL
jgi:NADH dehydrogenase